MHAKRILIVGNYGAGNLGDDAILAGILTELKTVGYHGAIELTHGGFDSSHNIYSNLKKVPFMPAGIRSFFKRKLRKEALASFKRADLVILGGGGLFVDSESIKAPMIWAAQARACRKLKTPYICYGQSVGPLRHFISRWITKKVFKNAKAVHVRDEASKKLLNKMGVSNVSVGTDPAFAWLNEQKKPKKSKNIIAISLREWGKVDKEIWSKLIKEISVFAQKKKLKPIIFAMDLRNEKELEALRQTGIEIFEPTSAEMAFEGIQTCKMAITMRLHAGIFAIAANLPLLTLSYSTKVESLFNTLNAKNIQILDPIKLNNKQLKKALNNIQKPKYDIESPLMQNQAFLAHALDQR